MQAYLYGHPKDVRARYRTPAEFVPHLLWLISNSTDRNDCSCQFCVDMAGREVQAEARTGRVAFASPSKDGQRLLSGSPRQQPQQHPSASLGQPRPRPATSPIHPGMTGRFNVFRIGEMVWYKHAAWRLGVVLKFAPKASNPNPSQGEEDYQFLLAPLGHSLIAQEINQQNLVKEATSMRPFLTFSVPDITVPELTTRRWFTDVDWPKFLSPYIQDPDPARRVRKLEIVGLEASKMAARQINGSFSAFNQLPGTPITTVPNAHMTTGYGGVYLGAEMIQLGDPIRIAAGDTPGEASPTVMIVQEIVISGSHPGVHDSLLFRGNIYQLHLATTPPQMAAAANPAELCPACLEEVSFRNSLMGGGGTTGAAEPSSSRWVWSPLERDAVRGEADVQGRFYVTHKLMRVIDPARAAAALQQRTIEDAQAYLNYRMHSGTSNYCGWRPGRAATLGAAVRTMLVLPEGIVEGEGS